MVRRFHFILNYGLKISESWYEIGIYNGHKKENIKKEEEMIAAKHSSTSK